MLSELPIDRYRISTSNLVGFAISIEIINSYLKNEEHENMLVVFNMSLYHHCTNITSATVDGQVFARIHSVAVLYRGGGSRPYARGGAPLTGDVTATTALRREAVSKPIRNEALSSRGYSTPDSLVDTHVLTSPYTTTHY